MAELYAEVKPEALQPPEAPDGPLPRVRPTLEPRRIQLQLYRGSPEGRYQLARSVLRFHTDLLVALTAGDHQAGLAYDLGRAVADLSLRPRPHSQASLTTDLRSGRVETIVSWLKDLHTVLPPHSAGAVMGSITQCGP